MTIIQWNVNGYYQHLGEIQNVIAKHNPEYLCIQEIVGNYKPNIKGYNINRKDRENVNHVSGGVAIFTINKQQIDDLIKKLPRPYIIVGYFNAHNTNWGYEHTDTIEENLENEVQLNDNTSTHFSAATGKETVIDIAFYDPRT